MTVTRISAVSRSAVASMGNSTFLDELIRLSEIESSQVRLLCG